MVKVKLSELLGKNKMTRKQLAELTGVRPNTIGDLYNENVRRIDLSLIDQLCYIFDCNVEDILQHVTEENKNER